MKEDSLSYIKSKCISCNARLSACAQIDVI